MNGYLLSFLVLFFVSFSFGQSRYFKVFQSEVFTMGSKLTPLAGGECIVVGDYADSDTLPKDVCILKIDEYGDVTWAKHIKNNMNGTSYARPSITRLQSGQFIVIYKSYNGVSLIKLDSNGSLIWSKCISNYVTGFISNPDIIEEATGTLILSGKMGTRPVLGRLDANGNLLWMKVVLPTTFHGGCFTWIEADAYSLPDGSILQVGMLAGGTIAKANAVIVKYNQSGDVIWFKLYGGNSHDLFRKVLVDNDGSITAIGYTEGFGKIGNVMVMKLNPQGNELWTKLYYESVEHNSECIMDAVRCADGSIIMCGYQNYDVYSDPKIGLVMKISVSGDLLWSKIVDENIRFSDVEISDDGDLLFTGDVMNRDSLEGLALSNLFVAKTDSLANFGCSILNYPLQTIEVTPDLDENYDEQVWGYQDTLSTVITDLTMSSVNTCEILSLIDFEKPSINVYPNPAKDVLHVKSLNSEHLDYKVKNLDGRLVKKGLLKFGDGTINVSELGNGLYVLIIGQNRIKFVKEH